MQPDPFDAVLDARSEARYEDDPRAEPDTREVSERAMMPTQGAVSPAEGCTGMGEARGYSKVSQLQRGPKRPARIKASPTEWARIRGLKLGTCRCYSGIECAGRVELHHIVPRSWGGDDVPENIAPLCSRHHLYVTERRDREILERLAESLTDDEYAYCIVKLGEGALERLFGVLA